MILADFGEDTIVVVCVLKCCGKVLVVVACVEVLQSVVNRWWYVGAAARVSSSVGLWAPALTTLGSRLISTVLE